MWLYVQNTGQLFHEETEVACGYSGAGTCKNDPLAQTIHRQGPIPCGLYSVQSPRYTTQHGPYVLPLWPHQANEMFGRTGFLIHGDSIQEPGSASEGCIILGRSIRQRIWESGDHDLKVIPEVITKKL